MAGEILIGGPCLARGYLRRPGQTARSFIPDPLEGPGGRLYRSGDLGRWRRDGEVEFLGRADDQVKIRGFRIELGEVSAALAEHPAVSEATVIDVEVGSTRQLAAYLTTENGTPQAAELRAFLTERLPVHMVPAAFVGLERLPLTRAGKVDRRALPEPEWEGAAEYLAPRTATEEILAAIWSEVLGFERAERPVGVHDDFFDLGGHSLLVTRVVSRLREAFGVEVAVRQLFETPTVAGLASVVEAARSAGSPPTGAPPPPLVARADKEPAPLSFAQERLWFLAQLDPEASRSYNMPIAMRLAGAAVLRRVGVGARRPGVPPREPAHSPACEQGTPHQVVAPPSGAALPVLDLAALAVPEREAVIAGLALAEARRDFDLERGPLFHPKLVRSTAEDNTLFLTMHHVISDGWSIDVLVRDLGALYGAALTGKTAVLPALPVSYADYAVWQRDWLSGQVLEAQLEYWRLRLAGAPALLELPTDRPRPKLQGARGGRCLLALDDTLSRHAGVFARQRGTTLFMVLLAAFQALLARWSDQDDVVVGSPIAGRTRREIENLVGFFVNTLVLRGDPNSDPSFMRWLDRVRETTLEAYAHQELPFERLVEELSPERSLSHTPLFQVLFTLRNTSSVAPAWPEIGLEALPPGDEVNVKFDLSVSMGEAPEGLAGSFEYDAELFDATTVERFVRRFRLLLAAVLDAPERPVATLGLVEAAEHQQLTVEWVDTGRSRAAADLAGDVCRAGRSDPGTPGAALRGPGVELRRDRRPSHGAGATTARPRSGAGGRRRRLPRT